MEELDVMVRSTTGIPRPRPGADRRPRRRRSPVVGGPDDPRPPDVRRPAPRQRAVCGVSRARHPGATLRVRAGAAPERTPRTRACLAPPRAARYGAARPRVRTRSERFLVGVATVLCSAVVVVALGLVADASAGSRAGDAGVPAGAVAVPASAPGWGAPAASAPWDAGPSGAGGSR